MENDDLRRYQLVFVITKVFHFSLEMRIHGPERRRLIETNNRTQFCRPIAAQWLLV